jgi:hypothetical protein
MNRPYTNRHRRRLTGGFSNQRNWDSPCRTEGRSRWRRQLDFALILTRVRFGRRRNDRRVVLKREGRWLWRRFTTGLPPTISHGCATYWRLRREGPGHLPADRPLAARRARPVAIALTLISAAPRRWGSPRKPAKSPSAPSRPASNTPATLGRMPGSGATRAKEPQNSSTEPHSKLRSPPATAARRPQSETRSLFSTLRE